VPAAGPPATARAAVTEHVEHLTDRADAYAAKQYARADRLYRANFEHTYDLGGVLAGGLLPPADAKVFTEPICPHERPEAPPPGSSSRCRRRHGRWWSPRRRRP
jgi:hypothetical protein